MNIALPEHQIAIMSHMPKKIRFSILLLTAVLASCTTIPEPFGSPPEGARSIAVFYSRWVGYLERVDSGSFQADCRPRLIEPAASVPYRGTVVLLHAFAACPQQFFEWSELLALQGYRSMLVVLPGHGRPFDAQGGEDLHGLPVSRNWQRKFALLAAEVNGIMAYADGDRVIGGLSAGATASLYINSQAPELYDRHILLAPLFAFNEGAVSATGVDEPPLTSVDATPVRPRQACLEKREQGRAGYCDYQPKHSDALSAMGGYTLASLRQAPLAVPLQLIGVEMDPVVSNSKIREFLRIQANTGKTSACFFPLGVPHDMISQYDFPGIEMYWLDSLLNGSVGFITAGRRLPVIGQESVSEAPYPLCAMETERRD